MTEGTELFPDAVLKAADVLYTQVASKSEGVLLSSIELRAALRTALGRKRLSAAKLAEVVGCAHRRYELKDYEGRLFLAEDLEDASIGSGKEAPSEVVPSKPRKAPPSVRPAGYMGKMLEGTLRDADSALPLGTSSAKTFCHCPHCGTKLMLTGEISSSQ